MSLKPEARQRWLAIIAGAAVGIFALDRLVLQPYVNAWRERSEAIAALATQVARGEALMARGEALEQRWDRMRRTALPADRSAAEDEVLRAAARWARESRVNFTSLTPQWRAGDATHELFDCRASISGGLGEVARFIYELERDPITVQLEELQVAADDDRGRELTVALRFSGVRFVSKSAPGNSTP
ncbi:MAG: hypothetical protein H7A45_04320 [Verrucomicrobiales bacterium]|nr:hypothetical protein [Verrucomicrobiales bacterium]MCP5528434.1 hypothetical protein [Verrucomicrobiales bacterium]